MRWRRTLKSVSSSVARLARVKPHRAYWGRGLATEAGKAFVEFGFGELKLSRIVATVQVGNDASVRVLTNLGFRCVRREEGEYRTYDHFELQRV